jgi:transposase
MGAPMVLGGPTNQPAFLAYVQQVFVPPLEPGDIVMADNLPAHKGRHVREVIKAAGASLVFLPAYSPDFDPIENAFANLKALLRKSRSEPPRASGAPSDASSNASPQPNAPTTSEPPDTIRIKLKTH